MIKVNDLAIMKAIALCYKPYLKPEEACIYCNIHRTQLAYKCAKYGITKSEEGYFKRETLDKMMAGELTPVVKQDSALTIKRVNRKKRA